jgi:hypothetical protein
MKKLLLIFTLLFSVMFSSTSFAEWGVVDMHDNGTIFYIDFDTIKKDKNYVYFWEMANFPKPIINENDLSLIIYKKGNCKTFKFAIMEMKTFEEPMGLGVSTNHRAEPDVWHVPPLYSIQEITLTNACSAVNN